MNSTEYTWQLTAIFYPKNVRQKHSSKYLKVYGKKTNTEYDYPLKTGTYDFGFFSSRINAEMFISESKRIDSLIWFYKNHFIKNYIIKCYISNSGFNEVFNIYLYSQDGQLFNEALMNKTNASNSLNLSGSQNSLLKFNAGDIIEYYNGNTIQLAIVSEYSRKKEEIANVSKVIYFQKSDNGGIEKITGRIFSDILGKTYAILTFDEDAEFEENKNDNFIGYDGQIPQIPVLSFYILEPKGYISTNAKEFLLSTINELNT